ncbi:MAG TPA: DUF11 domain-containing protein, partial [Roseiflexaceae bacterium]|nr:DUF11 domain-containing protein [Roseiflexaceae bacterium]
MPRRVWGLIGCLLAIAGILALSLSSVSTLRAAPLGVDPTNTGTPLPPTPTDTTVPDTPTATGQVVPTDTPTTGTESPTATPKPRTPDRDKDPTATPTPTAPPIGDPRVTKSADPSSGFPGDKITFTITVHNDGPVPATDVAVEDSIPGVFSIDGASTSQGTVDVSGQTVRASIGTIEPGGSVSIRVSTTIRADAQPGQVDNVAIMTNNTPGDVPGNNTSTTTVTIQGGQPPSPTALPPARLPPTGDAPN